MIIDFFVLLLIGDVPFHDLVVFALVCPIVFGGIVGFLVPRLKLVIGVTFAALALVSLFSGICAEEIAAVLFVGLFGIGALPVALASAWLSYTLRRQT